ncbi:hypothetical protein MSAN_01963700 [Mycena sanguinolenta]|uniref:DUF6532 domain-containing protein n=1 Tax=Mycena sanguinolenta TaxID=230812 RepID=A0A8H7CN31_9AGAR|nr:hypothetical protein MSAN_01963700 [Mycena sanguinolenta]
MGMGDSDDELSPTTDEENLTPAEKSKRTRARNLAQEEAANKKLSEETGGRRAKHKALQNKDADEMEIDEEPPRTPAVVEKASKKAPVAVVQSKDSRKSKGNGKVAPVSKRKYQITVEDSESNDDDSAVPNKVTSKPSGINSTAGKAKSVSATAIKPTPKPKPKKIVDDENENEDEDDNIPSQSEGEQVKSDLSQSEDENEPVDLGREGALVIEKVRQASSTTNSDDEDHQSPHLDLDVDALHADDEEEVEDIGKKDAPEPVKKQRMSAQQLKYEQEKPAIRPLNLVQSSKRTNPAPTTVESDWDHTTRIVFPKTGGQVKLLDQTLLLKTTIKAAIDLHVYEIAFKAGYESTVSRRAIRAIVRRLMRLSAKKQPNGSHIEDRAKKDLAFCGYLTPIILTRGGNVRTGLRNSAISKVATHYELNKPGTSPAQVRSIVKQLLDQQRYIFPYAPTPTQRAGTSIEAIVDSTDPPSAADEADNMSSSNAPKKGIKNFMLDLPFHAPAIVDVIHEAWWIVVASKVLNPEPEPAFSVLNAFEPEPNRKESGYFGGSVAGPGA